MSGSEQGSAATQDPGQYYVRQHAFEGIGRAGQELLAASTVAVVGCGGTGSVVAEQLARAGVGTLRLIDRDFVEWENLQRQVLFEEDDARSCTPKAVAGARKLHRVNGRVLVEAVVADVHPGNVGRLIEGTDLVVDGTDNFETRYLLNDTCVRANIPWIYTAAVGSTGMTMTILPGRTACLKCLLPSMPSAGSLPTCASAGVLNSATGAVASIASAEALKVLVGTTAPNPGLQTFDLWDGTFRTLRVTRRSDCPACAEGDYSHLERREGAVATALCGRDAVQLRFERSQAIGLSELADRLQSLGEVELHEYLLRFRAEGKEMVIFEDGRAVVRGVADPSEARQFYAKYVGT